VCSLEFPDLEASFWQAFRHRGLVVWGVAEGGLRGGDTDAILRNFVGQTGVTFPVVRDRRSYRIFRSGVSTPMPSPFPLDVLIDRQGRVVSIRGAWDADALAREVDAALGN